MSAIIAEYGELIFVTTKAYLTPIFILGFFGNLANIVVFSHESLRINGCSWYFIGVSLVNLLVILVGVFSRLLIVYLNSNVGPFPLMFCKIRTYFIFNGYILSRLFLCIISIDRWMITSQNTYLRNRSNSRIARRVIIISTIICFSINLFVPIGFEIAGNACVPTSNSFYLPMYTVLNLFATFLPFIILVLFSILTVRNIFKSKNRANRRAVHPENGGQNNNLTPVTNVTVSQNRNKEWQLIRLCLIQASAFLLLNIPNAGFTIYQYITKTNGKSIDQQYIDLFIQSIVDDLYFTESAVCFILIEDK
jgi:hypothetical protein